MGSTSRWQRTVMAGMRVYLVAAQAVCLMRGHSWRARYDLWPAIDLGYEGHPGSVADVCDRCRSLRNFRTVAPGEASAELSGDAP